MNKATILMTSAKAVGKDRIRGGERAVAEVRWRGVDVHSNAIATPSDRRGNLMLFELSLERNLIVLSLWLQ